MKRLKLTMSVLHEKNQPPNAVTLNIFATSHQSEWPSSKNLQTINTGEGVEKREPSCPVGGNVN